MTRIGVACGLIGALLVAGCNVSVNNRSVDNQLDAAANDFGNITDAADRAAENVGNAIENQADALQNGVDVNVNLRGRQSEDNTNKQ
jgi:hypothetical protein